MLSGASSAHTSSISPPLPVSYRSSIVLPHCLSTNKSQSKWLFYLTLGLILRLLGHSVTPPSLPFPLLHSIPCLATPKSPLPTPQPVPHHVYWTQIRLAPWQPRLPGNLAWVGSKVPPGWHCQRCLRQWAAAAAAAAGCYNKGALAAARRGLRR